MQSITSFALYGFPESHAASFALIAYAQRLPEGAPPDGVLPRPAQRLADGLLPPGDAGQGRAAARRRGAAGRRPDLRGALPLGGPRVARGGARSAHRRGAAGRGDPPRLPLRARPARPGGAVDREPSRRKPHSPTPATWCGAATSRRTNCSGWPRWARSRRWASPAAPPSGRWRAWPVGRWPLVGVVGGGGVGGWVVGGWWVGGWWLVVGGW